MGLGFAYTKNVFFWVRRILAAADIDKVKPVRGLIQCFLISGRIAEIAVGVSLNYACGFCIIFLFANDLLHRNPSNGMMVRIDYT